MDNKVEDIIEQIVENRKKSNMSQRLLAYYAHMPQSTLARIETKKTVPGIDTIIRLADALDMDVQLKKRKSDIPEVRRFDGLHFCAYWKDELISKVDVEGNEVFITRYILHPVKQIFWTDKMDVFQLTRVFEGRCWERGRSDIQDILHSLGLSVYDPFEIVKKTHGVSYNDFLWFQFEGENLNYKDLMPWRFE